MNSIRSLIIGLMLFPLLFAAGTLCAASEKLNPPMEELLASYLREVQKEKPEVRGFSAGEGKRLYFATRLHSKKNKERSCTTCHTKDPGKNGRTPVGKTIKPIARSANSDRFTDPKKVEKWFRRNCKWVLERECTPEEKGNYITFMLSR